MPDPLDDAREDARRLARDSATWGDCYEARTARRLEAVMALLEEWESGFATMHEAGSAAALRRALTGETP